jgi:hypothetical protein
VSRFAISSLLCQSRCYSFTHQDFSVVEQTPSYRRALNPLSWDEPSDKVTTAQALPVIVQYVKQHAISVSVIRPKPNPPPPMLFSQYGTGSALDVLALAAAHRPAEDAPPLRIQDLSHGCSGGSGGCRAPNSDLYPRSPSFFRSSYIGLESSARNLHISDGGSYFEKESVIMPRVTCRSADRSWQANSTFSGDNSPTSPHSPNESQADKVRKSEE